MARSNRVIRGAVNPPRRGLRMVDQPALAEPKSKRDRFVTMVNSRMSDIITRFDEFCKICDREYYDFTDVDQAKVLGAFDEQVDRVRRSFQAGKKVSTFKLD